MDEPQVKIMVFHLPKKFLPEVEARGFNCNSYDTDVSDDEITWRREEFLSISFAVDVTGFDFSSMQLNEHALAKALGIPPVDEWEWSLEICSDDALPAGTYWIGDISSVACEDFKHEIPGFDEVFDDTIAGDLIRSVDTLPGLFYAVLPCNESFESYVDVETGDRYDTKSRCIGIIPKSLMSQTITEATDTGGDYLIAPLEIAIKYDISLGAIRFGSDELGGVKNLSPFDPSN